MITAPQATVIGPQPTPPRHGFLDSAIPVNDASLRWELGFSFYSNACEPARCWVTTCLGEGEVPDEKCVESMGKLVNVQPFEVYLGESCSTTGFQDVDYEGRVQASFDAAMVRAIENNFWGGGCFTDKACAQYLAHPDVEVVADGAPQHPKSALMALLQKLASCGTGGRGAIHASPALVLCWVGDGLVVPEQGRLVTVVGGHTVIAGVGYTGSGPGNAPTGDPNLQWAYATGMIYYRISAARVIPETFAEAVDTRTNKVTYIAERTVAAYHDGCCHAGVLIDLCAKECC